ncbi:hypothetical protein HCUR_00301 [Holospora curviuscula]|uniref:Uncharacterized protein n=1 Tax=Holospora curviuscula TaxID=1082868 RepID=A0A2S5RDQ9_9PROT|nr:hypothetical protein HCUR_00301 [Holospora curviuscula]
MTSILNHFLHSFTFTVSMRIPRFSGILFRNISFTQQVNISRKLVSNIISSKVELIKTPIAFVLLLAPTILFSLTMLPFYRIPVRCLGISWANPRSSTFLFNASCF